MTKIEKIIYSIILTIATLYFAIGVSYNIGKQHGMEKQAETGCKRAQCMKYMIK